MVKIRIINTNSKKNLKNIVFRGIIKSDGYITMYREENWEELTWQP